MAILISFERGIGRAPAMQLGPFKTVELAHRRISADGRLIAVRKTSGIWAIGVGFLEVHIQPGTGEHGLSILFADPWRMDEVWMEALAIRLVGERLLIEDSDDWIASDQDEERSWIVEASGNAFDRVLAA
jgi:hypothetical protein